MLRKYHRIVSLIVVLPFALVLVTGLFLQLRQQFDVIQPQPVKMQKVEGKELLSLDQIIAASGQNPANIGKIIYSPVKFHVAVQMKDGNELQIHPQTGEILKSAMRYTNILIELHQGSFFTQWGQYLIFFPAALGVVFLTISGMMIYPWRKSRVR